MWQGVSAPKQKALIEALRNLFLRGGDCMFLLAIPFCAQVVELVDTQVSEACA